MNITDKELKAIASTRAREHTKDRTMNIVAKVSGALMIIGAIVLLNGYMYGIAISSLGLVTLGVVNIVIGRRTMSYVKWFTTYYHEHGKIPEDDKYILG